MKKIKYSTEFVAKLWENLNLIKEITDDWLKHNISITLFVQILNLRNSKTVSDLISSTYTRLSFGNQNWVLKSGKHKSQSKVKYFWDYVRQYRMSIRITSLKQINSTWDWNSSVATPFSSSVTRVSSCEEAEQKKKPTGRRDNL